MTPRGVDIMKYCSNCGAEIKNGAEFCSKCGSKTGANKTTAQTVNNTANAPKSKMAAGLLGIFLGYLGIHNFYLGYNGKAIAQLLMTVLSCGLLFFVTWLWGFIEGILILTGSVSTDAEGNPLGE